MKSKLTIPQEQIDAMKEIRRKRLEELKKRAESIELAHLPKGKSYRAIAISVDARTDRCHEGDSSEKA